MTSPSSHPTASRLRHDLRASVGDGVAFSVMVGVGESYVAAFALALGLGEVLAGLIASIPLLAGALLQLAGPWAVRRLGSLRRWVVLCALTQAAAFAPLVAAACLGWASGPLLFVVMSLYWAGGLAAGPAWNAWMEVLVPARIRAAFFASRSRACHLATLAGLGLAGGALHLSERFEVPLWGFAGLFAAAGLARVISAGFLGAQAEAPPPPPPSATSASWRQTLAGNAGWLLGYMLLLQLAVWVSVPYFTPYMLDHLHLSYGAFTLVNATAFVARILALPLLGRLVKRVRADRLLLLAALGVTPISGLWAVSGSLPYLLLLQLLGGTAWAAYELTTFLLVFDTIPRERRVALLTVYNVLSAVVIVVGSLIGGALLAWLGTATQSYLTVFLTSSGLRLLAVPLLLRVRVGPPDPDAELPSTRPLAVRPGAGALERPVLAAADDGA